MTRILLFFLALSAFAADSFDPKLFAELRWRGIGPLRGGRTKSAQGVPGQPNVFYIGVCNGGVWKTADYGRTWKPIFDDQPTNSIGALAVAPSDPNTIYVGSGEGLQRPDLSTGDGVYKSTDAGKTWTHLGLRDGQQIPQIAVDPKNPNRLFVAVLGHPYGPNPERGLYRSTNGGTSFQKVLGPGENTGANDVQIDPSNPNIVYASLWEARQGPWENSAWTGPSGGLFKSTDGGDTWKPLTNGIPGTFVQANFAIAPSQPQRLYASIATSQGVAIYRSDNGGEQWRPATTDTRPASRIGGGDVSVPTVDPQNPDIVYVASTVAWKSTDGGRTWTGFRGAPGGDDYQRIWINPTQSNTMLIVSDQGAIITVNGGESFSSWYNQSTAQMYHVNADNAFPYRVCGGQQESGSACVSSRGDDGQITFRDWHPVGVEEYGYAVPDPLDPNIIYGGKITRFDRRTAQVENIAPKPIRDANYRALRTAPVAFSPADPHLLFFAANTLFRTSDGGRNWREISPDLSRKTYELPASIGKYKDQAQATQRGVIYAIAPSPLDVKRIWAGTDDGLIHLTVDSGTTWKDVTPKEIGPFMKISILEAGHFSPQTAYAAINTLRLDDMRPHIFRTHDGGKTWAEIVNGIPNGAPVDVVREDPKVKGLLYAGTEREVYVSFNDGDTWQSLRLNMPASSIRDLIVKDDDLVVATHGRGFWILDDITPLRQINSKVAGAEAHLYQPQTATRVRWNMNTDTPLPPDEPAAANPPDGAILNYYLGPNVTGEVTIEILDATGSVVRKYSSNDPEEPIPAMLAVPKYWARAAHSLPGTPGMHRYTWDMHHTPLNMSEGVTFAMQAIYQNTPPATTSMWATPGRYTVRLTANGKTYTQPLTLKMDPRVKTLAIGLQQNATLSKQLYADTLKAQQAAAELITLRANMMGDLQKKATDILGTARAFGGRGAIAVGPETLTTIPSALTTLLRQLEAADVAPTTQLTTAIADRHNELGRLLARLTALKAEAK